MKRIILAVAALAALGAGAQAADRIKLGFVASQSGVGIGGAVGEEQRRGLDLALELSRQQARRRADHALCRGRQGRPLRRRPASPPSSSTTTRSTSSSASPDRTRSIPVEKTYIDAGVFVIGALAGPQEFAGKACSPNAFFTSFENEDWDDTLAPVHDAKGRQKSVYFMAADYQAGWEKIGGAMRFYKGKAIGPVYTPLHPARFRGRDRHSFARPIRTRSISSIPAASASPSSSSSPRRGCMARSRSIPRTRWRAS